MGDRSSVVAARGRKGDGARGERGGGAVAAKEDHLIKSRWQRDSKVTSFAGI